MKVNRSSLHIYRVPPRHFQLNKTVGGLDEVDHHRNRDDGLQMKKGEVDHVGVVQAEVILK